MSIICSNCSSSLPLSPEQQAKLDQTLDRLQPGEALKLKCPKCGNPIEVSKPKAAPLPVSAKKQVPAKGQSGKVQPPPPPPLEWLDSGELTEDGKVEDVPMAMLVYKAGAQRDSIEAVLQGMGYQTFCTEDAEEAKERMRFTNFLCIVYQSELHGRLSASPFHAFITSLNMDRRRKIIYILTGAHLRTLYDLEALALSANLTINYRELPKLQLILRKATQANEDLFGKYLEELEQHMGI